MGWKGFLALLVVYIVYLMIGAVVFKALEQPTDCQSQQTQKAKGYEVKDKIISLKRQLNDSQRTSLDEIMDGIIESLEMGNQVKFLASTKLLLETRRRDLSSWFENGLPSSSEMVTDPSDECEKWNLYGSFFFAFTAITTIGYGNQSPVTPEGRWTCIFYSLFGIPINGLLVASIASFFTKQYKKFRRNRPQEYSHKNSNSPGRIVLVILQASVFLVFGIIIFILAPSVVFFFFEDDWQYVDCVYFAFITLSTIGFGDLVAGNGKDINQKYLATDTAKIIYEVFVIVWIIFGLGYIFMVITLVTDAYTKSVALAARKLKPADKQLITSVLQEVMRRRAGGDNAHSAVATAGDIVDGDTQAVEHFIDGVEDVNDATMHSFYHFLATAVKGPSGESSNLLTVDYGRQPNYLAASAPGSRRVSTNAEPTTVEPNYQTVHNHNRGFAALAPAQALDALQEEGILDSSSHPRQPNESSTLPIPDFLKDVTLEELLVAADNVRQRC